MAEWIVPSTSVTRPLIRHVELVSFRVVVRFGPVGPTH
jgi:hypothetical protein